MSNRDQQSPERLMALLDPAAWPVYLIPIEQIPFDDVTAWQPYSLCSQADPEAWFPDKGGSTRDAKKICFDCPVRAQCLEYALANDERFGVWGGLSERDRRKLRKKRNGEPADVPDTDADDADADSDEPGIAVLDVPQITAA